MEVRGRALTFLIYGSDCILRRVLFFGRYEIGLNVSACSWLFFLDLN